MMKTNQVCYAKIAKNELGIKSRNFGDLKNALSKTVRGKNIAQNFCNKTIPGEQIDVLPVLFLTPYT